MEVSQIAVTDPSWFYSTIAQSTAALVGFVGGFYIFRLQTYLSEWAAATRSLETLQQTWATVFWEVQQDDEREAHSPTNPRPQSDAERLKRDTWRDLRRELDDQAYTSFPGELRWLGLGLAALFIVGCVLPLLLLGSPSNAEQIGFVIPVSALVLAIGGYMDRRASNEFRKWKTTTHYSIVDTEYEQQQINEEQWAGEDARRGDRAIAKRMGED